MRHNCKSFIRQISSHLQRGASAIYADDITLFYKGFRGALSDSLLFDKMFVHTNIKVGLNLDGCSESRESMFHLYNLLFGQKAKITSNGHRCHIEDATHLRDRTTFVCLEQCDKLFMPFCCI